MQREPPSRESNPFATCWTRPGALPYRTMHAVDPAVVIERLRTAGWRGQVVGPHGAGKTTLLAALVAPLREHGPAELLLVEGFERRSLAEQRRCLAGWRDAGQPHVVTTHRTVLPFRGGPPVVARLRPSTRLLDDLFASLVRDRPTRVTCADARRAFRRHAGNLREVWFDLYLLHEQRVGRRTAAAAASYDIRYAVAPPTEGRVSSPLREPGVH